MPVSTKAREFVSNEPIEGETLADRLAKGGLPAQDALRYALDIGAALNRAHNSRLVHGKLSPHAILLTASGARIVCPADGPEVDALAYRSPEQVAGQPADSRSDIFSFGTLLYEMASGRRAFSGEGAALDRAIVDEPPAILMSKSPVHAAMEGVIAGCLEKDPAKRRQRVQNAIIELRLAARSLPQLLKPTLPPVVEFAPRPEASGSARDDIRPNRSRIFTPVRFPDEIQAVPGKARKQRLTLWALLVVSVLFLASGGWILWQMSHTQPAQVVRFPMAPPQSGSYRMPAISPDGKYVVVQSEGPGGRPALWLRPLDAVKLSAIPGTEDGFAPFWSPDSQYVAFFSDRQLKKVRISDGSLETVCGAGALPGGGTWNESGTIVFAPSQGGGLYQVPAAGGKPLPLQPLNAAKSERAHLWPQFLPDGNHFIFFVLSNSPAGTGVYAGSLDSHGYSMLLESATNAVYSPDSGRQAYLLFVRDRALMRVGFDAAHLKLTGDPAIQQADVGSIESLSLAPVSVSNTGILVYQTMGPLTRQLCWMDRTGKLLNAVKDGGDWGPLRISPDGNRAAAARKKADGKSSDIWLIDSSGGALPFTSGPARKGSPVWSPDGSRIAYYSETNGDFDLVSSPVASGATVDLLLRSPEEKYPTDWSHDGKYLLFNVLSQVTKMDVWALSTMDRHAGAILDSLYSEGWGVLSPDGHWLAYQSNESGQYQVYVQPFDGVTHETKRRYDISTEGGGMPRWRADGRELFYLTSRGQLMSVQIHADSSGFRTAPPQLLFHARSTPPSFDYFDVSPDGQRFLMNLPLEWGNASPIMVVTNWTEKVKAD